MEDSSDARVQLCRQELLKLDIQVKTGITQLESEFNYESMAELTRFSQRLKEKSNSIDDLIVDFIGLAKEQKTEEVKTELIKEAEKHRREQLDNLYRLRSAVLSAVKRLENKNRSDLFGTSTDGTETRLRSAASAQQMLDQSTKVTNNLGGLLAQMSSQVKQSEETLGVLLTSSEVITETEGEFNSMRGQIHTSNALLSKYARREITDRFLLALALLLYFGTVAYIVRKRLFGV